MRAITVLPGAPQSSLLENVADPPPSEGALLVRAALLGVCATDREIVSGRYGSPPPGQHRLILGHESLGHVEAAPAHSGFERGDLVVGIVRRPDPEPCTACGAGEWDMCLNGGYSERGIKERNGYGSEYFRVEPEFAIRVGPELGSLGVLLEPASILAKAWDHTLAIGARSRSWRPRTVLVTGAGPIGLLAALMGAQRGLEVHVFNRGSGGPKEALVRDLGGTYHTVDLHQLAELQPDVIMECTGAANVIRDCLDVIAPSGIICLTGFTSSGSKVELDVSAFDRVLVLNNRVVFGTVNANRDHYLEAEDALRRADKNWLARLITRRVPLDRYEEALDHRPGDIKVVIDFAG
jgi:threonine dehydrogenase-like Zn-dependent dehydrogenase